MVMRFWWRARSARLTKWFRAIILWRWRSLLVCLGRALGTALSGCFLRCVCAEERVLAGSRFHAGDPVPEGRGLVVVPDGRHVDVCAGKVYSCDVVVMSR